MIVAAAVLPTPPLLVPELVGGAVRRTAELRATCVSIAAGLAGITPIWWAVAGDPAGPRTVPAAARGTFASYGVDVPVSLGRGPAATPADPMLPLPALVAGWLRAAGGAEAVETLLLPPDLGQEGSRAFGADLWHGRPTTPAPSALAAADRPVGLVVLGDGSIRHGGDSPAPPHPAAAAFDDTVAAAFAAGDHEALLRVTPRAADEQHATGRVGWQVLAGVVAESGRRWRVLESHADRALGVGYHMALWSAEARPARSSPPPGTGGGGGEPAGGHAS
ncbi:hypothetical protein [Actinoalloteichus spitiensis]|uniref:hypothetical protein n=1 Tax=Actinoalloteichus spitiensis TaxID=252394 RepID=UPI000380C0CE|nr:hypothetical protein [Actinoalloteichus spitiensis]